MTAASFRDKQGYSNDVGVQMVGAEIPVEARSSLSRELSRDQGAFVIQFRAVTDVENVRFSGRAEHIASGQIARFETLEALAQFVRRSLRTT